MKRFIPIVAGLALVGAVSLAAAQSTDALVDKYTTLAGSKQDAAQIVERLRKDGLGNGEINIALSLAQVDMAKNNLTLDAALEDLLKQRAGGEGWGKIAQGMGVKLGDLVRSDRAKGRDEVARNEHGQAHPERPERAEKPERPERPERPEKPERPGR